MDDSNASERKRAQVAQLMAESRAVIKVRVTAALPQQNHDALERALRNVLATEAAQITYAQIIDGFPIRSVANDRNGSPMDHRHPVFQSKHDTLCPGVWEKMKEFHASFKIDMLALDGKVSQPRDSATTSFWALTILASIAPACLQRGSRRFSRFPAKTF